MTSDSPLSPVGPSRWPVYRNIVGRTAIPDLTEKHTIEKLLRQQTALANFGSFAFGENNIQKVLAEAARTCAKCSNAPYAKICRYRAATNDLIIEAAYGWQDGVMGTVVSAADESTTQGRAFLTGKPVILQDLSENLTYALPAFYAQHKIVATADVLIKGSGEPWGVLEIDSTSAHAFDEHDIDFLTGFANVIAETVGTAERTSVLRAAIEQMKSLIVDKDRLLDDKDKMADELRRHIVSRTQADEEFRQMQDRLRQAVAAGNVGLWDWDLRTNRVRYSVEWKSQIGYDEKEISDDVEEWRSRIHEEDLEETLRVIDAYRADQTSAYQAKYRFRHKNGTYRHILSRGLIIPDDDGSPVRFFGSHVDLTEFTELQAQFQQIQKMESVGRLAGGIAHDLNNILTVVIGSADLMLVTGQTKDPARVHVERILQAGNHAAGLTRQLLAFSRQQLLKLEVVNLTNVVAEIQPMLCRLIGENIELVAVPSDGLGNVLADAGQIGQVIVNLVVNARDAMPSGGTLTIAAENVDVSDAYAREHPSIKPGPHVVLAVSDTGTGMDETVLSKIFDPFFTTKKVGEGTGLGLSTVYGIVKQCDGHIWAYSQPGQGTTFKIYFPLVDELVAEAKEETESALDVRGETILVVEDQSEVRDIAVDVLKLAGYAVLSAGNGMEALSIINREDQHIHLMITDLVMPGMSGLDLASTVSQSHPGIKILYTSGYSEHAILQQGVPGGPSRFIDKPYSVLSLRRKVRSVLDAEPQCAPTKP